ncbi:pPIWI_RE module domain-containing protein [Nocardia sp. NPDC055321]
MGFSYQNIRRAAYRLDSDATQWTGDYRALPFPEHARESLLKLCNHGRDENGGTLYRTVPTYRLDGVLQSLAPDLVVRSRSTAFSGPGAPPGDFWLYVPADLPDPLPTRTMHQLFAAWLTDLGRPAGRPAASSRRQDLLLETLAELEASPPLWQPVHVDLLGCPVSEGGTAAPASRQYQLATDALARRITALDPYDFGIGTLRFRAVPRGPRQRGAELMSQPIPQDVKGKTWWFSITINISLHTVPWEPLPRLHLHTGVRRWATHPRADTGKLRLPFGRATSVYLRPTVPWLPGAPTSERYAVARLNYNREAQAIDWQENGPAGILRRLTLSQSFPDPEQLLSAPEQWLNGSGVRGAVVYSNQMGVHGIGSGLMSHQRSVITEWAEQALPDGLVRTELLSRSAVGTSKPANARPAAERAEEIRAAHARRGALAAAVVRMRSADLEAVLDGPPVFEARLLWQTATSRRAAITGLAEILGLEEKNGAPTFDDGSPQVVEAVFDTAGPGNAVVYEWRTPELIVRLRCLPLSRGLADKLALDPKVRPRSVALTAAIARRRGELAKFLSDDGSDPGSPTLALVEIAHRSTFRPATTDPKFVMRLGCADAGVLTQFVVVPSNAKGVKTEKNVDHRVRSGWLDALRQFGVRVLPEHTLGGSLPEDLRYAAIWMVKRRKDGPTRLPLHLPVAVLMTPMPDDSGRVQVQGWDDDTKSWTPYPKFLLGLVKKAEVSGVEVSAGQWITSVDWRKNMDQQRKETASFLQRVLFSLRDQSTVLIAHSQNSRQHWPWLQDGNTVVDLIKTGHAPPATLDPNLRLVRIRGGAGRETPQWWGTGRPDGINGLPAGLWKLPTTTGADLRVFYSTTEKASQFKKSAVSANRLAPRAMAGSGNNWTIDADKPAWNPSLVEIAVFGCHPTAEENNAGDDPEALALAMHQLRQAPDYLDALSLPLPLHLAGLAQAYVLPMLATDEDFDDPDIENENDTISDDLDPDLASAPGLAHEPDPDEQPALSIS